MAEPLSIISTVDLCFKWGAILVEKCSAFVHAADEVAEGLIRISNCWIRTKLQLQLVQRLSETLDEDHQKIQNETLEVLVVKLKATVRLVESVSTDEGVRRLKYAVLQTKIEKAIIDLEHWQKVFDPSWYLLILAATPQIDDELRDYERTATPVTKTPIASARRLRRAVHPQTARQPPPVFYKESDTESLQIQDIPMSPARLGLREDPSKALVLDSRIYPSTGMNGERLERDVRDLARKLVQADPFEFGLLQCKGVVKHNDKDVWSQSFTFVFRLPPGCSEPRSMRHCLAEMQRPDSLSDRFRLASELAKSVLYVHTFGFVHKNIRPETILLLRNGESVLGSSFLIGFDTFRSEYGHSALMGSTLWERSLYQHPDRIGPHATQPYVMQHDIYSLGVCLLELGLWESFITDRKNQPMLRYSLIADAEPPEFKDRLLSLARGELKSRMGNLYSQVVETCLTCLDPGNADFGDKSEFQDVDGIQVGMRYIEKITMRLSSISV